jgi:hypothetical protein
MSMPFGNSAPIQLRSIVEEVGNGDLCFLVLIGIRINPCQCSLMGQSQMLCRGRIN